MGWFKKTKEIPNDKEFTGSTVSRDVTQEVAICINQMGITKTPTMSYFNNDKGIFDGIFMSHINDPQVDLIKKAYGESMYLSLLGCHALGAGAYITLCQAKYNKTVSEWTYEEAKQVDAAFRETDPYELALKSLGFALDGNNKKCLDHIVQVGVAAYCSSAGKTIMERDKLKDFMQVMYNAGITIVTRK